jgi:hypothetical protein
MRPQDVLDWLEEALFAVLGLAAGLLQAFWYFLTFRPLDLNLPTERAAGFGRPRPAPPVTYLVAAMVFGWVAEPFIHVAAPERTESTSLLAQLFRAASGDQTAMATIAAAIFGFSAVSLFVAFAARLFGGASKKNEFYGHVGLWCYFGGTLIGMASTFDVVRATIFLRLDSSYSHYYYDSYPTWAKWLLMAWCVVAYIVAIHRHMASSWRAAVATVASAVAGYAAVIYLLIITWRPLYEALVRSLAASPQRNTGCLVSTACTRARGLPDDCEELLTLRRFRDEYVLSLPIGPAIVEHYYSVAPALVRRIDAHEESQAIYTAAYRDMVVGCCLLINRGSRTRALATYMQEFCRLRRIVGE